MRSSVLTLGLVLVLSFAPSLAQGWAGKGAYEPSTQYDTPAFMFQGSPQTADGTNDIYFNGLMGFQGGYLVGAMTGVNPNVATVQTAHQTYPYTPLAMLGVWLDCNKDTYIGLGDNALLEYRSELLTDTTLCPPTTLPSPLPKHGALINHNDGEWVREFISIGPDGNTVDSHGNPGPDVNGFNINDWNSRVWVDDGPPGGLPVGTCYTTAYPQGTFHSVGGIESLGDCFGAGRFSSTISAVVDTTGTRSEYETLLATQNPWGNENDASDAYVWDCGQPAIVDMHVTGSVWVTVSEPSANPNPNTAGSPGGTANWTGSGLYSGCEPGFESDHTNPGQALANAPYRSESDQIHDQIDVRLQQDFTLGYYEGTRPFPTALPDPLGRGTPEDMGVGQPVYFHGLWADRTIRAASYNPFVDRRTLQPEAVTYLTFYAVVSPGVVSSAGLHLPGTAAGVYGGEACSGFIDGIHQGWACDPANWYPEGSMPTGLINGQTVNLGMRPGDAYYLRDVDCYDESVGALRDLGIGYGLLTQTECK